MAMPYEIYPFILNTLDCSGLGSRRFYTFYAIEEIYLKKI